MENNYSYSGSGVQTAQVTLMKSLYLWMSVALAVTGITAMAVDASYQLQQLLFSGKYTFLVLVVAELALVIYLSARIARMSFASAMVSFLAYSFLNGLTLSVVFLANTTLYWITTYAGVLIFVGLTAYDTNRIKQMLANQEVNEGTQKLALLGALTLYLDFINMFLYLLRIFGDRR